MNTMGRFLTALSITVLLFATAAAAQFNDKKLTATVPFDFTIGKTDLPAGTYIFLRSSPNSLLVRDANGLDLLTVLTGVSQDPNGPLAPKLRFRDEAGRKVLFEVWQGDGGMELYRRRPAIELAKTAAINPAGNGRH